MREASGVASELGGVLGVEREVQGRDEAQVLVAPDLEPTLGDRAALHGPQRQRPGVGREQKVGIGHGAPDHVGLQTLEHALERVRFDGHLVGQEQAAQDREHDLVGAAGG